MGLCSIQSVMLVGSMPTAGYDFIFYFSYYSCVNQCRHDNLTYNHRVYKSEITPLRHEDLIRYHFYATNILFPLYSRVSGKNSAKLFHSMFETLLTLVFILRVEIELAITTTGSTLFISFTLYKLLHLAA